MRVTLALVLLLASCAGSSGSEASLALLPTQSPAATVLAPPSPASAPTQYPLSKASSPASGASASATPGGTVRPKTIPEAASLFGPPLVLSSLQMVSTQVGWATGWTLDRSAGGLLRTTDGGASWQVVAPPGVDPTGIQSPFFLDANHAWFVFSSGQPAVTEPVSVTETVERTSDGGSKWLPGAPLRLLSGGPGWLDFIDAQHGWYMANLGESGGSMAVEILLTSDGGLTWESVSNTDADTTRSAPGSLPVACNKTGLSFASLHTGWATAHCATGGVFLYLTSDGGRTWQNESLSAPRDVEPGLFQSCDCETTPPVIPPGSNRAAVLKIFASGYQSWLYYTQDGGQTWNTSQLAQSSLLRAPIFVSPQDGWTTNESQLFITRDAGQTWSQAGRLPNLRFLGTLDLVNLRDGWATGGVQAYETHNGGQTWLPFSPFLRRAH